MTQKLYMIIVRVNAHMAVSNIKGGNGWYQEGTASILEVLASRLVQVRLISGLGWGLTIVSYRVIWKRKPLIKNTNFGLIFCVGHPRGGFIYPQKAEDIPYMKIKSKRGRGPNLAQKSKTAKNENVKKRTSPQIHPTSLGQSPNFRRQSLSWKKSPG